MTGQLRRSIFLPGHEHGSLPIPAASRVGPMLATGGVRGVDRLSGELPSDASLQIEHMFNNLKALVEAGGANIDHIVKVTVWVANPGLRALLNPPWERLFPHANARPARHVLDYALPGNLLVQCEALAFIPE